MKKDNWYWLRAILACTLLVPLWLVERAIHALADFSDWLKWLWNNASWLWWLNDKMSDFVGGPTHTKGPKP